MNTQESGTIFLIISIIYICISCKTIQKEPLKKIEVSEYPIFSDDLDLESLKKAVKKQLNYFETVKNEAIPNSPHPKFSIDSLKTTMRVMYAFLQNSPTKEELKRFIEKNFEIYKASGRDGYGSVLYTGYYLPLLQGSLRKTEDYKYPLYRMPDDLVTINLGLFRESYRGVKLRGRLEKSELLPYYSRTEIDKKNAISKKNLEFVWVKNYVNLFFLQIQGSGRVQLIDGEFINVNYENTNGYPYVSIGRLLLKDKKIPKEEITMQSIKKYFKDHPKEIPHYLFQNESYIFFRQMPPEQFPLGCLNIPLTDGRSIAADSMTFPKGALALIRTEKPVFDEDGNVIEWKKFSRFVLDQDKGGAIKGPGRIDIFFGFGEYEELASGNMKQKGELYYIIKKNEPLKY